MFMWTILKAMLMAMRTVSNDAVTDEIIDLICKEKYVS